MKPKSNMREINDRNKTEEINGTAKKESGSVLRKSKQKENKKASLFSGMVFCCEDTGTALSEETLALILNNGG